MEIPKFQQFKLRSQMHIRSTYYCKTKNVIVTNTKLTKKNPKKKGILVLPMTKGFLEYQVNFWKFACKNFVGVYNSVIYIMGLKYLQMTMQNLDSPLTIRERKWKGKRNRRHFFLYGCVSFSKMWEQFIIFLYIFVTYFICLFMLLLVSELKFSLTSLKSEQLSTWRSWTDLTFIL